MREKLCFVSRDGSSTKSLMAFYTGEHKEGVNMTRGSCDAVSGLWKFVSTLGSWEFGLVMIPEQF